MEFIKYKDKEYFAFQASGNASQFAIPYAKYFCKGEGYDIGYCKNEWKFPGAIGVEVNDAQNGNNLPDKLVDFIYSSHCLEHVDDWVSVLIHWASRLKPGGIIFLYLPSFSQEYWRPWNNRKHKHVLTQEIVASCLVNIGFKNVFTSGEDFNLSFMVVGEK